MLTRLALVLLMAPQFIPRPVEDPTGRYFGLKQVGSDPYGYESVEFSLTSKATKVPVALGSHKVTIVEPKTRQQYASTNRFEAGKVVKLMPVFQKR